METDKFKLAQRFIELLTKLMVEDDIVKFMHLGGALIGTLHELGQVCNEQEMDIFFNAWKTAGHAITDKKWGISSRHMTIYQKFILEDLITSHIHILVVQGLRENNNLKIIKNSMKNLQILVEEAKRGFTKSEYKILCKRLEKAKITELEV